MPALPAAYWTVIAFLFGAIIGSFLNVVIWRMPRRQNLSFPPSHCPRCDRNLAPWENIPMVSFLALRARCRTCGVPISWRYFCVELLTAVLFVLIVRRFGPTAVSVAYCLFTASMIAAFFIDLELFIIPEQLNTFCLFVGFGLDAWGIAHGYPGHSLLWGWLPRSLLGAVVCAGVFVLIQLLGFVLFKKEAMGDGDVKLARAIGALLPLSQALVSFLLAIAIGAVVGVAVIIWIRTRPKVEEPQAPEVEEEEESPYGFGDIALQGGCYLTFMDLALQLKEFVSGRISRDPSKEGDPSGEHMLEEDDNFVAGPTHIPFGPAMVAGAIVAMFFGDTLVTFYLRWARLS